MHFKFFLVRIVRRRPSIPLLNNYLKEIHHFRSKRSSTIVNLASSAKSTAHFFKFSTSKKVLKASKCTTLIESPIVIWPMTFSSILLLEL